MGKSSLIAVLVSLGLTGCSLVLPRDHDPVMFSKLVDVKIAVSELSCDDKEQWKPALVAVNNLAVYTELRDDPQKDNIKGLKEALVKAKDSKNVTFCKGILKTSAGRIDAAVNAWRDR